MAKIVHDPASVFFPLQKVNKLKGERRKRKGEKRKREKEKRGGGVWTLPG